MAKVPRPLIRRDGYTQELAVSESLPAYTVQSHASPVDIVPWQAVALQTTILIDGVTGLITANNFTFQASWAIGRTMLLEIIGGASLAGGGCAATLLDPNDKTVASVTATSTLANGITTNRSTAFTLTDGVVYRPAFHAVPASSGVTVNLTASLRLLRLVFI